MATELHLPSNSTGCYLDSVRRGRVAAATGPWSATTLPPDMGSGWIRHLELRPGMETAVTRYQFPPGFRMRVDVDRPAFTFACVTDGRLPWAFEDGRDPLPAADGTPAALWAGPGRERFRLIETRPATIVSVTVSADVLRKHWSHEAQLPPVVETVVEHPDARSFIAAVPLTTELRRAAHALAMLAPDDPLTRLRAESYALTIVCEHFAALGTPRVRPASLSARAMERMHEVRRFLSTHPEQSPTLGELARMVATNECTLKHDFRLAFGTSVHGYLRSTRMNLAAQLLRDRAAHVAEVGERLGYRSPSRFAVAFRRHFGVSPKTWQLQTTSALVLNPPDGALAGR